MLGSLIRVLLLSVLLASLLAALASCGKTEHSAVGAKPSSVDVKLLATDIHISIAQHTLVLPFIAFEDYAYRKQTFSLDRRGDRERAASALKQFLQDTADPAKPLMLDKLAVVVRTYGWNDFDMSQRQVCSLLTREWAQSVCDNPWAALQQALPANRFNLVDLSQLKVWAAGAPTNCRDGGGFARPLPESANESVMLCHAQVSGGDFDEFHTAALRIEGDLGAVWTVWRNGQNRETAEAMTEREGKAIAAFVQYAIGPRENFAELRAAMCRLRRPPIGRRLSSDPHSDCDGADPKQ